MKLLALLKTLQNKQRQGGFISAVFLQPVIIVVLIIVVAIILWVIVQAIISLAQRPARPLPDPDKDGQESPPPPIVQTNGWIVPCAYCDQNSDN